MSNRDIQVCQEYAEAVFQRVTTPLQPENFRPNWLDQPSRYKIYQEVERIAFTPALPERIASMACVLERMSTPRLDPRTLTGEELQAMLLLSHGALARRIGIDWNGADLPRTHYTEASYGRGTPSGGGMYPTEIYWVCGPGGSLTPGIYHYDNAHHALARLLTGDVTDQVRAALFDYPAAATTNQFLLITLNFWKNSFKYSSFSYHVVAQDLGALLCSLRMLATGFNADLEYLLWFEDQALNTLLGLEARSESVFAVIPLPSQQPARRASSSTPAVSHATDQASTLPFIQKASYQRSKKTMTFSFPENAHLSALVTQEPRPAASVSHSASYPTYRTSGERVDLPPPDTARLQSDLATVFQKRRSSFGRLSNAHPLSAGELGTLLFGGCAVRNYRSDLKEADGTPHFARIMAFVNNVKGIEQGIYAYDPLQHCLWTVQTGSFAHFLQKLYFLPNYNMEQTGAVLTIVGKVRSMLETYGNRGYRLLCAEVGMVAQGLYMTSTALSFGCGAILGFNNVEINKALGFDGTDERSFLLLPVGHQRPGDASFDLPLVWSQTPDGMECTLSGSE